MLLMLMMLMTISNKEGIDDDADADDADKRSLQTREALMMMLMPMMLMPMMLMIISNKGGIDAAWAAGGRRWHLVGRAHKPPVLAHHQVK